MGADPLSFSDLSGLQREGVPNPCQDDPSYPGCHGEPPAPGSVVSTATPWHVQLAKNLSKRRENGEFNECEALARFAEGAAKGAVIDSGTVAAFGALIKPNSSDILYQVLQGLGLMQTEEHATYLGDIQLTDVDNNYKPQFKDDATSAHDLGGTKWRGGNNADQSHHFALFIQVGYYSQVPGVAEFINSAGDGALAPEMDLGDLNLGYAAISIGRRLRSGAIKPGDLGKTIRADICR